MLISFLLIQKQSYFALSARINNVQLIMTCLSFDYIDFNYIINYRKNPTNFTCEKRILTDTS